MSLDIPPEFERAVLERVRSGQYASSDEVLRACPEALREVEEAEAALEQEFRIGLDQLDRGEGIPGEAAVPLMRGWREEDGF
jgi:Arc/MetJ-type ribon-helix-helix transcriptional regulator